MCYITPLGSFGVLNVLLLDVGYLGTEGRRRAHGGQGIAFGRMNV